MNNIKKFIISILAFLLTIFPRCGMLLAQYQSLTFPGEAVVSDKIIDAINEYDIDALAAMMSEESKKAIEDLPGRIEIFIDTIDGEIISYEFGGGGYEKDIFDYAKHYSLKSWELIVETDEEKSYAINITWIIVNDNVPEEVGMTCMTLGDTDHNLLAEV